jgi:DNA-binding response OmpR family regulator
MPDQSKIVIADSEAEEMMSLIAYLEGRYDIADVDFSAGGEPVELIARLYPDIILVDDMLVDPNCYELCHLLKSDISTHNIPLILMSDLSEEELEKEVDLIKADDYIHKPIDKAELLEKVDTLLEFNRAR